MKKIVFSISVGVFFLFSVSSYAQIPVIEVPNGSFENWIDDTTVEGWNTKIGVLASFGHKTDDGVTGDYAMLVKGDMIMGAIKSPGICTLGEVNVDPVSQSISYKGGIPFTYVPTGVTFYAKYIPDGADTMQVLVFATKWNSELNQADMVAMGVFQNADTISDYNFMIIPVNQVVPGVDPDTLNIVFLTDISRDCSMNTELYIDDIWVAVGYGGIVDNKKVQFTMFPNPATENVYIQMEDVNTPFSMQLFDITGKKLLEQKGLMENATIRVENYPRGIYMLRIEQNGVEVLRKIAVE